MSRNANPIDQNQSGLYDNGEDITNFFEPRSGVFYLPIAEDPPTDPAELAAWSPVVALKVHAPYRLRKVVYKAEKSSNPPVMPSPVDAGSFVFLRGQMVVHNSLRQDQLGFDWAVTTMYDYVENAPVLVGDGLVLGTPPWLWPQVATAVQSSQAPPATPGPGASGTAGAEVLYAKGVGDRINPSASVPYNYSFPSFYPGTFFNDFLVNGGPPTVNNPRPVEE